MVWVAGKAGQANARSDFYIALDVFQGATFPVYVLVRYAPQATTDRPQAPPPSNGFDCNNSPFDRGHVCALELGGPDISENIVPQWRHWQETGPWRQFEATKIPAVASPGDLLLFQVVWPGNLQFAGAPPQVDDEHYQAYAAETLIGWDDYRIPTAFRFWHVPKFSAHHGALGAALGTADQRAGIEACIKAAGQPTVTMQQDGMPEEDHAQLERQQIVNATQELCDVWAVAHERQVDARAEAIRKAQKNMTRRSAALEARKILGEFSRAGLLKKFGPSHAKVFQELLRQRFNYDDMEAGHFTASRIMAAHSSSYPRQPVKKLRNKPQAIDFKKRRGAAKAREKAHAQLAQMAADIMQVDT